MNSKEKNEMIFKIKKITDFEQSILKIKNLLTWYIDETFFDNELEHNLDLIENIIIDLILAIMDKDTKK